MVGNLLVVLCAPRALAQTGRLPDDVGGLPKRGCPPKDPTGSAGAVAVPEPEEETP